MNKKSTQPDWNQIAEKFDLWLPQLAPVSDVLLNTLNIIKGDKVLDLASGTGEPALTIARRMGNSVMVSGIDCAKAMVKVAQTKARQENLESIVFQSMAAEQLAFTDAVFDKVVSRFGLMLFEDPLKGIKEMHRVMKKGARFALTVWSTAQTMPTLEWSFRVMSQRLPQDKHPPLKQVTSLGDPALLNDLLRQAGFTEFNIDKYTVNYEFQCFDDYWNCVETSDILKLQLDSLSKSERTKVRNEISSLAMVFSHENGLRIPHEYQVISGSK